MKKHTHKWERTDHVRYSCPLQYEEKCSCGKVRWIQEEYSLPTIYMTKEEFNKRYG